jgi:tetratricopeptide (TPR) repeat protein
VITASRINNYLRILLVSLFIALLGLAPQPHAGSRLLVNASKSLASGDFLTASQNLADAGEYFPWRYDLNLKAGRFAMQAGDPKKTIQYFEHPGTISHLSYDDMIMLGDAYSQTGDPSTAETIWKNAIEKGDSSQAYERLTNLYLQRKDFSSAINELQHLLTHNPSDISLYYQIGSRYAVSEPIKALSFLAQAAEIDPASADRAQTLHDKIRTASLFGEPAYTLLIAGRQLANWGEWELALEAFHKATLLKPDYADAWAFIGEARQQIDLFRTGTVSDAGLPDLEYALQMDPNSTLANTLMGFHLERQGKYSQAQIYLERAIASSPDDPFLYSELGNILGKAGDLPAAQSAYEAAIQLNPQDPLFYRLLAEFALQYQIQIRELALPAARQAITLDPDDASSLDIMAQVMLMLQDYHSAERFAQTALQSDPGFTPAYLHLGTAYLYLGESHLAHQILDLAKAVDPDSWVSAQASRMLDYYFP